MSTTMENNSVEIPGLDIPGLTFRYFSGDADFEPMVALMNICLEHDKLEETRTVEVMRTVFSHARGYDPYKDVVYGETDGRLVVYKRASWWQEEGSNTYLYAHGGFVHPDWRGKGIGRAILRHSQARGREMAAAHPKGANRFFEAGAPATLPAYHELLQSEGYSPVRTFYDMVRPNMEDLPEITMPEGLEVRPVTPDQFRMVFDAEVEAFHDHWGDSPVEEGDFDRFLNEPNFQPDLWLVAWDGDQVAGMVRNFIDHPENEKLGRKRGYVENISTRRPWRKRGLASALIARSFRLHKDLGMTEASLSVDSENPSGALRLYEAMGFRVTQTYAAYRRPFED